MLVTNGRHWTLNSFDILNNNFEIE